MARLHLQRPRDIAPINVPRGLAAITPEPPALFLLHEQAADRFFGFFTGNIRNKNTRRACSGMRLADLAQINRRFVCWLLKVYRL